MMLSNTIAITADAPRIIGGIVYILKNLIITDAKGIITPSNIKPQNTGARQPDVSICIESTLSGGVKNAILLKKYMITTVDRIDIPSVVTDIFSFVSVRNDIAVKNDTEAKTSVSRIVSNALLVDIIYSLFRQNTAKINRHASMIETNLPLMFFRYTIKPATASAI